MDLKQQLDERLINFSTFVIDVVNYLPDNRVGNHLGGQLLRSGTSPALNFGKALDAESRNLAHELEVILKELRESYTCLRILLRINYITRNDPALLECNELISIISIFVKNRKATKKNSNGAMSHKSPLVTNPN